MTNKIWIYKQVDHAISSELTVKYGLNPLCADVLQNRMEVVGGDADNLYKRVLYQLHNPFLLNDMEAAVQRINEAILRGERITVYGDYDADGVTSTAILYMFLTEMGANAGYYIPDRITEGYGLNRASLERLREQGTDLLVTVDTGIAAVEEIAYARALGMDVIVTDHHECQGQLPDCTAVLNPKRRDSTYPYSNLAGVGVTFKLMAALNRGTLESLVKKYILLVCLGTIADVVPLHDENRAIVTMGLKMLPYNQNTGLKSLFEVSGVHADTATAGALSFSAIPRINAAGRMEHAGQCVELLLSKDVQRCRQIAQHLDALNAQRQEEEQRILEQALRMVEGQALWKDRVLVVAGENWHHGVIGIVASRITEKYYKPCILLSVTGDTAKGSGRSVAEFDLFAALCSCAGTLAAFGGHPLAAGVTLKRTDIEAFRAAINAYAETLLQDQQIMQKLYIDRSVREEQLCKEAAKSLAVLEPYGMGNPKPLFALTDVRVLSSQTLTNGKHLKLRLQCGGTEVDAIGFGMGEYGALVRGGDFVDVAGNLEINAFRGVERIQIVLKDIKRIRRNRVVNL